MTKEEIQVMAEAMGQGAAGPKPPDKTERMVYAIIVACAGYFAVQAFNKNENTAYSMPAIEQRLTSIEASLGHIEAKLEDARQDPFTGADGERMKKTLEVQIDEVVSRFDAQYDELEMRVRSVEVDQLTNNK